MRKRCVALLLAVLILGGSVLPAQRAQAIVGVDDLTIAAVVLFAASVGVTFSVQAGDATGFNDWLGHRIQDFLSFSGRVLEDFFSLAARSFLSQFGIVRLSSTEASLQAEFLQYMQSQSAGSYEKFDGYMKVDGQTIFIQNRSGETTNLTINSPVTLVPFPSFYPSFSLAFSDYYRPSDNYHMLLLEVFDGTQLLYHNTESIGTYFKYYFYIYDGVMHLKFWTKNGLSDENLLSGMYDLFWDLWLDGIDTMLDTSGLVTDTIDGMVDNQAYVCPDVIGWDSADVSGSIGKVISGAIDGTLDVAGTVEDAGEIVPPDVPIETPSTILDALLAVWETIKAIPKAIVDGILAMLKALFIPTEESIAKLQTAIDDKLPFISDLQSFGHDLAYTLEHPSSSAADMRFTTVVDLKRKSGGISYGSGQANILDMTWYMDYKPMIDDIIECVAWLVFLWNLYGALPAIIHGGASGLHTSAGLIKWKEDNDDVG